MPTYEYGCPSGHRFEKFYRKISDATGEVVCPECEQVATRRMSAGAGLIFKGSGFYITDYGKDGKKSQTPAAASADAGGSQSDGGGASESAPSESKSADGKGAESKSADGKSGDGKSSDGKSGDGKPAATKPAESKPAPSSSSGGSSSE